MRVSLGVLPCMARLSVIKIVPLTCNLCVRTAFELHLPEHSLGAVVAGDGTPNLVGRERSVVIDGCPWQYGLVDSCASPSAIADRSSFTLRVDPTTAETDSIPTSLHNLFGINTKLKQRLPV